MWTTAEWIKRQQELARAGISLEEANARLRRNLELLTRGAVSFKTYDERIAAVDEHMYQARKWAFLNDDRTPNWSMIFRRLTAALKRGAKS